MIDWGKYFEEHTAGRIQRKKDLLEKEKAKAEPDKSRIRMLEADIWYLQNS